MNSSSPEKLIIIGSGPAALTAAIYAARACLQPVIIEGNKPGGQLMSTTAIENWPGEKSIMGPSLMLNMRAHAQQFGTRFISQEVTSIQLHERPFILHTNKKKVLTAQAVIIATGATPKRLHCAGEDEYWCKGVSTCAVCDGAFYPGKRVIIVGGGDSAMENASFMTNFTDKITVVHILAELTASKPMQQRVVQDKRITVIYESTVTAITGDSTRVTQVIITNHKTGISTTLEADAVFIAIGLSPNTALFKNHLELTSYGYIVLKQHTETSVEGVFAAGDVADARYRQAITSAASGCAASLDAERYLKEHEIT